MIRVTQINARPMSEPQKKMWTDMYYGYWAVAMLKRPELKKYVEDFFKPLAEPPPVLPSPPVAPA